MVYIGLFAHSCFPGVLFYNTVLKKFLFRCESGKYYHQKLSIF